MSPSASVFEAVWRGVGLHLWQTTLVLVALLLLSRALRSAPARVIHSLWWVGVAKLFLPLPLLERWSAPLLTMLSTRFRPTATIPSALTEYVAVILDPLSAIQVPIDAGHGDGSLYVGLTVLWCLCVGLLFRHWHRMTEDYRSQTVSVSQAPLELQARLRLALAGAPIPETCVRIGALATVPAVVGALRPSIVISSRVVRALTPDELRAILLHENCHRLRHDPLWGLFVRFALLIYFFYPPVWWLARQLRETSELSCDEWVLDQGIPSTTYARSLAHALSLDLLAVRSPTAVGLGQISKLRTRLSRIDHPRRYRIMLRHRMTVAAAALIVMVSVIPIANSGAARSDAATRTMDPNRRNARFLAFPELTSLRGADTPINMNFQDQPLEEVFGAIETALHVRIKIDGQLPTVSHFEFSGGTAAGALEQIGLEFNLAFDVEDSENLRVYVPPTAGLDGVSNPRFIEEFKVQPIYPEQARVERVEGRVIVQAIIRKDGSVGGVKVLHEVPEHPEFAESAIEAIRQWRYEPSTMGGLPIDTFFTIFIEFKLDGSTPEAQ